MNSLKKSNYFGQIFFTKMRQIRCKAKKFLLKWKRPHFIVFIVFILVLVILTIYNISNTETYGENLLKQLLLENVNFDREILKKVPIFHWKCLFFFFGFRIYMVFKIDWKGLFHKLFIR